MNKVASFLNVTLFVGPLFAGSDLHTQILLAVARYAYSLSYCWMIDMWLRMCDAHSLYNN